MTRLRLVMAGLDGRTAVVTDGSAAWLAGVVVATQAGPPAALAPFGLFRPPGGPARPCRQPLGWP